MQVLYKSQVNMERLGDLYSGANENNALDRHLIDFRENENGSRLPGERMFGNASAVSVYRVDHKKILDYFKGVYGDGVDLVVVMKPQKLNFEKIAMDGVLDCKVRAYRRKKA